MMKQRALVILNLYILGTLADGHMEKFRGGQCFYGYDDVILYDTTFEGCVDECRARVDCKSISVKGVGKICRLHVDVADVMSTQRCSGYVFSEKAAWSQPLVPGCECMIGAVCESDDVELNSSCVYRECPSLPRIPNGTIYGNSKSTGSKVIYECDPKFKVINGDTVRICETSGKWSGGPSPTCVQYEFYLPVHFHLPDYSSVNLFASGINLINQSDVRFSLKATNDAHVMLSSNEIYSNDEVIEIVLGGWGNTRSAIRLGIQRANHDQYDESGIISSESYKYFWIITTPAFCVQVGKGTVPGADQILELCGYPVKLNYIYIGVGFGSDADFVFLD